MAGAGCCCGHGGGYEVRSAAAALAAFEVAVGGRGAALAGRELVGVHCETHAAAGFAPLETRVLEDAVEAFYLGLLLQAGALLAIGTLISTMTRNQIIAGAATFVVCLMLLILDWVSGYETAAWARVLAYMSVVTHFEPFSKGVLNTKDAIYYVSLVNPFTHCVELIRFALYGMFEPVAALVVAGATVLFFLLATIGYDPQRGMIRRAAQPA